MDIKECHRVLELELGASRDAVETAYCQLMERWHPDRVSPAGDPAGIREAARMVQEVNEAYQTLIKIAPQAGSKPITSRTETQASASRAEAKPSAPAPPRSKPILAPIFAPAPTANPPPPARPISPLPLPGNSAPPGVPAPAPGAATPPPPRPASPPPPPPSAVPPPPVPENPAEYGVPGANAPARAGRRSQGSPKGSTGPIAPTPVAPVATPAAAPNFLTKARVIYDMLFPVESPRRRFGPYVLAAALLFLLLLGKCAFSSSGHKTARPDPTKTGSVVVKSNRPDTIVELTGGPVARDAAPATFHGSGPAATISLMPPGKYALTAKSEGWPDVRQDVSVDIGRSTEVVVHFMSGSLRLDSDPSGATVRLGGAVLGKTPLVIPQLPLGECQLSLEYPSWPAVTVKTIISESVESTEAVRLPHGKLMVESTPPGATVLLGGRAAGQTPLTLNPIPAGIRKLTLQGKDFPPLEVSVTVDDGGEVKVSRELGLGFPDLDPPALLRAIWKPESPNQIAPGVDSLGRYEPRNGIVRNLNRKRLYEYWLRKSFRYSGTIKSYDRNSGQVEFAEQKTDLSSYHVLAEISLATRNDKDLVARLTKGATLNLYGRLNAVEESRWTSSITFEMSAAEPLR